MGASRDVARKIARDQREWRLLLAGPRSLAGHPPVCEASPGTGRRRDRARHSPRGGVTVHVFVSATLCSGRALAARSLPRISMKAIQVKETGGAEQMQYVDVPVPEPGPKQARVKIAAAGVNFIDVYFRIGLYKADLPITLGMEAAGVVDAVGPDVTEVRPGDRVAYAMSRGSYAEYAVVPSWQLVKVPDDTDLKSAAAAMLQGMT